MDQTLASIPYEQRRKSIWTSLYSLREAFPGLLAMFFIAIFANNLLGVPNPFNLENLFFWLDGVVGPWNHQWFFSGIFQANFVWNAFLLGLLIGNIFGVPDSWKRGLSYIHKLMPIGLVMLAPHFVIGHAFKAGFWAIAIALVSLILTALITIYSRKLFKVDDRQAADIAGGLSSGDPHVCAILMPMIKAKGGQVINSFLSVTLFGFIAMMVLPHLVELVGLKDAAMGLVSVISVGNGAQAFSSAMDFSYEAGRWARFFDSVRHAIMPTSIIFVFTWMFIRKLRRKNDPEVNATRGVESFPWYQIIFIALWILAWFYVFKEPAHHVIFEMVRWDYSLAASALGLSMSFKNIWQWGTWRGFALTCFSGSIRIVLVIAMVWAAFKWNLIAV